MEKPNSPLYLTTLIANILIRLWLAIGLLMANSNDLYTGSNALLDSLIDISGDRSKMPEFMKLVRQIESGGRVGDIGQNLIATTIDLGAGLLEQMEKVPAS